MNHKIRTQKTFELILNLIFIIIQFISYFILLRIFFFDEIKFFANGYILLIGLYIVFLILFLRIYGGYKLSFLKVSDLIFSVALSISFAFTLSYIQKSLIALKLLDIFNSFLMLLLLVFIGCLTVFYEYKILYSLFPAKDTLLIYEDDYKLELNKLKKNGDRNFNIKNVVSINSNINDIFKILNDYDYILLLGINNNNLKNKIINECYELNKSIYLIPTNNEIIINNAIKFHLIDTPLLYLNKFGPSQIDKIFKRMFDIFISLILILIFFIPMIIVSIFIKLEDNGSIIYKQVRLTQYGREFYIYKFRSMKIDAEKNGEAILAKEKDDRITKVGNIIRKFRLDELPQLFNILNGDMSIVGPRPERPELVKEIYKELPEFKYRLKVKAGLTGYAQVYGKYNTSLKDKLLLDLMYIENYSLFLDFKVILMTIKIIFMKESTEGF